MKLFGFDKCLILSISAHHILSFLTPAQDRRQKLCSQRERGDRIAVCAGTVPYSTSTRTEGAWRGTSRATVSLYYGKTK